SAMHGYIYGKWTWQYIWTLRNIRFPLAGERGKEKWANHYHAKTLTLDQAESIIGLDHEIPLHDLEKIMPYQEVREFVLNGPVDVVLYECGCRRASGGKGGGCQPSQVCMVIGKPFTDLIVSLHPDISRRVTKEEALEVLREEDERGHMHTAWFKDAMMDRFYAVCNCCKCCCVGLRGMKVNGLNMIAPSGYSAIRDEELCTTCGKCANVCPFDAVTVENKIVVFDHEKCMGCGVCVGLCPQHAMSLIRDETKGVPLDVREMLKPEPNVIVIQH
ncbi:MAG: DUF362 domain-containing protein, partial [Candidatus Saccharibacteria bacterium]